MIDLQNTNASKVLEEQDSWIYALKEDELTEQTKQVIRGHGKQIAVFQTVNGILACDNRCPHEGYPLSEGTVTSNSGSDDCVLTCNWHNWKFNLMSGENLYGGDKLRTYPVKVESQEVWIDISELPYEERYNSIVKNLKDAFEDNEYDRLAREIARLEKIGADPIDSLRLAIEWSHDKMEFGFTHAYAGMADWLKIRDEHGNNNEIQLVCLLEPVSHAAFDVLREQKFPYSTDHQDFSAEALIDAIECEDENTAVGLILHGLANNLTFDDFEEPLTRAAVAHYSDFGHSLIYVTKTQELIHELGGDVAKPLLLSLVRSLIFATREEKIPEFRVYDEALSNWGIAQGVQPSHEIWNKKGIKSALDVTLSCSDSTPETIYKELLTACAKNMLSFDINQQSKIQVTVSGNVNWLDFSHALTFANAVRKQCEKYPDLWPQGLLQMTCFLGRNTAFTTEEYDLDRWGSTNIQGDLKKLQESTVDHGQDEHIVSVHGIKTLQSIREEIPFLNSEQSQYLFAAVNRFINSPIKRRQTRRTAYQSLKFVEKE